MTFDYGHHFSSILERVHAEKRYRIFNPLEKQRFDFPKAISHKQGAHEVVLWSTNDYLGLSISTKAIDALAEQAHAGGVGAGGTRNISGTHPLHIELEETLANVHHKEKALFFNSGYAANEWTLFTLGRLLPHCVLLSDAENHASMIAGIRASGASKLVFRHNDMAHLSLLLTSLPSDIPKVIVCESVYSMSGDFARLDDLCDLARTHNALLYVDEVHAVGLYGDSGGGVSEATGLAPHIDIIQGTLGKAFGTLGGYVAGNANLVDVVRTHASGFIFSTAMPAPLLAAGLTNIREVSHNPGLRQTFWRVVDETRKALNDAGLPIKHTTSHIIPLIVGDSEKCEHMSRTLLEDYGIYLQPINYPTVPKGTERFRITPLRLHTSQMIKELTQALVETWQSYDMQTQKSYHS